MNTELLEYAISLTVRNTLKAWTARSGLTDQEIVDRIIDSFARLDAAQQKQLLESPTICESIAHLIPIDLFPDPAGGEER